MNSLDICAAVASVVPLELIFPTAIVTLAALIAPWVKPPTPTSPRLARFAYSTLNILAQNYRCARNTPVTEAQSSRPQGQ